MECMQRVIRSSGIYRLLAALCLWMSTQWHRSGVIQWFINPPAQRERLASENSLFTRLWKGIHRGLHRVYTALHLNVLFEGSVFACGWLWCGAAVVLAPALPTMAVLGLVLVSFFSLLIGLMRDGERKLVYSPVNRYIWLYALIYLVGTLFSVTVKGSLLGGGLTVAFILFTLVLENSITTQRQLETVLMLMVMAGALISLYGILQYLFGWGYQSEAWVDSDMFGSITFRVSSTLENPNMLGQYLTLAIPLGGAGLLSAKGWGQRVFYFFSCGLMCVCMLLTLSRGAWVGLILAGGIFILLVYPKLLLLTPLILVVLYFVLPDVIIARFTSIGDLSDSSSSYRLSIWLGSIAMLKDYWLCGIGPGVQAFNLVYPAYSFSTATAQHSHNLFLQLVCDAGIVALVVFVLLIFRYARELCAAFCQSRHPAVRMHLAAFLAGCGGFLAQGMTDFSFYNYRVLFVFCAYLGMGILTTRWTTLEKGERESWFAF